jgi:hypothetical protein
MECVLRIVMLCVSFGALALSVAGIKKNNLVMCCTGQALGVVALFVIAWIYGVLTALQ